MTASAKQHLILWVLVEEAKKHIVELWQKIFNIPPRNAIYKSICNKINAVDNTRRATDTIKRRYKQKKQKLCIILSVNRSNKRGSWK